MRRSSGAQGSRGTPTSAAPTCTMAPGRRTCVKHNTTRATPVCTTRQLRTKVSPARRHPSHGSNAPAAHVSDEVARAHPSRRAASLAPAGVPCRAVPCCTKAEARRQRATATCPLNQTKAKRRGRRGVAEEACPSRWRRGSAAPQTLRTAWPIPSTYGTPNSGICSTSWSAAPPDDASTGN